jgi:hypothetical protein
MGLPVLPDLTDFFFKKNGNVRLCYIYEQSVNPFSFRIEIRGLRKFFIQEYCGVW